MNPDTLALSVRTPSRFAPAQRLLALATVFALLAPTALAVGKNKAKYLGGTINSVAVKAEGLITTTDSSKFVFVAEKSGGLIEVPYKRVVELEYGQKSGRRVAEAILLSPLFLFSKKRAHFLTITYKDPKGTEQAVIFELGKDIIRTTLTILETRTGRKVTYQDEEAAKSRAN
jgi:hypothetical protein